MKIILVSDWFLPRLGGVELQIRDLAAELASAGHHVHVVTTTPADPSAQGSLQTGSVALPDGVSVHRLDVPLFQRTGITLSRRAGPAMRGLLHTLEPDVVHIHASVCSTAALAGAWAADNADEIQTLLATAADKIVLVINGHSHIDDVLRVKNVTYMHVNSASYQWVGGSYRHDSYSREIHDKFPYISYTCPYRDSVFATFTFDPQSLTIGVEGRHSEWMGKSPAQLGVDLDPKLTHGEEISPGIRSRQLLRIAK